MIKNLDFQQNNSKCGHFAKRFTNALRAIGVEPSPSVVAKVFNKQTGVKKLKPHTVRKWLVGVSIPRSETLLQLAKWLNLEPEDLLTEKNHQKNIKNRVNFEFEFTDYEVIAKYLAMTLKEKLAVRLVIDAIANKNER